MEKLILKSINSIVITLYFLIATTATSLYLGFNKGKEEATSVGFEDTKIGNSVGVIGGVSGACIGWWLGAAFAPETLGLSLLIPTVTADIGCYFASEAGKYHGDRMSTDDDELQQQNNLIPAPLSKK